ncbi:hypothetical protein AAMO2058_000398800 [Amorphochlora amoebiformis]
MVNLGRWRPFHILLMFGIAGIKLAYDTSTPRGLIRLPPKPIRRFNDLEGWRRWWRIRGGSTAVAPSWQGLLQWSMKNQEHYQSHGSNVTKLNGTEYQFLKNAIEARQIDETHMIECILLFLHLNHPTHPKLNLSYFNPLSEMKIQTQVSSNRSSVFTIVKPRMEEWGSIVSPIQALSRLEDFILGIDNSNVFVDLGGVNVVMAYLMDAPNDETYFAALEILSVAASNNPFCSRVMVSFGVVEVLCRILNDTIIQEKYDNTFIKRTLSPLSSLAVMDPEAALRMINYGILDILFNLLLTDSHDVRGKALHVLGSIVSENKLQGLASLILERKDFAGILKEQLVSHHPTCRRRSVQVFLWLLQAEPEAIDIAKRLGVTQVVGERYLEMSGVGESKGSNLDGRGEEENVVEEEGQKEGTGLMEKGDEIEDLKLLLTTMSERLEHGLDPETKQEFVSL